MHRPKNPVLMAIMVAVLIGALGLFHYFVFYSIISLLGLTGEVGIGFILLGILLWLSFPFATFLAGKWDNRRTRYFYYLASVWLGFLQFGVLSFAAVWVILMLADWIGIFPNIPLLFTIAIVTTIVTGVYGLYNARIIRTIRVNIGVKNLPENWVNKKIALISDVHIGHILRANFLKRIVKRVNRENVEMLCIAGDLFDGMDGRLEDLFYPLKDIKAPYGIYYADGNHETYLGVNRAMKAIKNIDTMHILRNEIAHLDGIDIIGIDYPEIGEKINVAESITSLPNYNKNTPSILLFHTPFQIEEIAKTGVDIEFCGHTHKGQMWPFGIITKILFKGYDYGLSTIGDFSLYTSSGIGSWGPPMRVGSISEFVVVTLIKKL